jgi:hypothetical protein
MWAKHIIAALRTIWGSKSLGLAPSINPSKSPIMCYASIQKIASQTIRISRTLVFLCTGATIFPKCFRFIVVYSFLIVFMKLGKGPQIR